MNLLVSVAVLALQRVPFVNQIPAIRDAHTVERALKTFHKAAQRLENVKTHQRSAAEEQRKLIEAVKRERDEAIAALEAGASAAEAAAERAERTLGKLADILF
jgi:ribosome recycling factor